MGNGQNGRNGQRGGRALDSEAAGRVFGKYSGFRQLKAFQVAEVQKDYVKHLRRCGLREWQAGEPAFEEARALRPRTLDAAAAWVNGATAEPKEERAANLGAILAAQAHGLTERLLDRQARDLETNGGFAERLYCARSSHAD